MRQDLFSCLRNVPTWASCTDGRLYILNPAKPGLFNLPRGCFNPCYQPAIPGRWMARPDCSCIVLSYCESPEWSRQRSSCVWITVFATVPYGILLLAPGTGNFNKTLSTHDLRCHSLGVNRGSYLPLTVRMVLDGVKGSDEASFGGRSARKYRPCTSRVLVDFSIHYTCWTVPRTRNFRMRIRKKYFYNRFVIKLFYILLLYGIRAPFGKALGRLSLVL